MIYQILLTISIIAILTIIIWIPLNIRIKKIEDSLQSIKRHEERHSKQQVALLEKLLNILELSHPNIFNQITDEIDKENNTNCN